MSTKWRKVVFSKGFSAFLLALIGICFILPLLWVVLASFDPQANSAIKLPGHVTLSNYYKVITDAANQRAFGIGLLISVVETVLVVICSVLVAYPLSRYQMAGKDMFLYTILFMTSLPMTAVMVPVYEEFVAINLYDHIIGVIIFMTASSLPFSIWMMKNFMDSVPMELEEAAWVDGATTFRGIIKIVMPLMVPGVFTVAIFTFSGSWGDFFTPYILLASQNKFPAAVLLYQFFGQHGLIAYGPLAAYSLLYAMPSILLYILAQNYMSKGFSMQGATKG